MEQIKKTQENTTFVVNETRKPNSFEVGKSGKRFKLYFENADDLKLQIETLKAHGLYEEEQK